LLAVLSAKSRRMIIGADRIGAKMTFVGFANSLCLPRYLSPGTTLSGSLAGAMAFVKGRPGAIH
jgi:hypothetical protein